MLPFLREHSHTIHKGLNLPLTTVTTLASGSSGNAVLVSRDSCHILIDAGISVRRINAALGAQGLSLRDVSALLLTHTHSDHIRALDTLLKHYDLPIFASDGAARALRDRYSAIAPVLRSFPAGSAFSVGDFSIRSFSTSHDAPDSVCYRIDTPDGGTGLLTDTGIVPEDAANVLRGTSVLVLEANHDLSMLRNGPYPYSLQERIHSAFGHLSNDDAAAFAVAAAKTGTQDVLLAHLSEQNNNPALAFDTVRRALDAHGFHTVRLTVAPRSAPSPVHTIAGA